MHATKASQAGQGMKSASGRVREKLGTVTKGESFKPSHVKRITHLQLLSKFQTAQTLPYEPRYMFGTLSTMHVPMAGRALVQRSTLEVAGQQASLAALPCYDAGLLTGYGQACLLLGSDLLSGDAPAPPRLYSVNALTHKHVDVQLPVIRATQNWRRRKVKLGVRHGSERRFCLVGLVLSDRRKCWVHEGRDLGGSVLAAGKLDRGLSLGAFGLICAAELDSCNYTSTTHSRPPCGRSAVHTDHGDSLALSSLLCTQLLLRRSLPACNVAGCAPVTRTDMCTAHSALAIAH
eukprot:963482-Pleurochrysis_carterae.AAC.3